MLRCVCAPVCVSDSGAYVCTVVCVVNTAFVSSSADTRANRNSCMAADGPRMAVPVVSVRPVVYHITCISVTSDSADEHLFSQSVLDLLRSVRTAHSESCASASGAHAQCYVSASTDTVVPSHPCAVSASVAPAAVAPAVAAAAARVVPLAVAAPASAAAASGTVTYAAALTAAAPLVLPVPSASAFTATGATVTEATSPHVAAGFVSVPSPVSSPISALASGAAQAPPPVPELTRGPVRQAATHHSVHRLGAVPPGARVQSSAPVFVPVSRQQFVAGASMLPMPSPTVVEPATPVAPSVPAAGRSKRRSGTTAAALMGGGGGGGGAALVQDANATSVRKKRSGMATLRKCTYFLKGGCMLGDACQFLHVRTMEPVDATTAKAATEMPWKYKTELCDYFARAGHCRSGKRCHYAHGAAELRPTAV